MLHLQEVVGQLLTMWSIPLVIKLYMQLQQHLLAMCLVLWASAKTTQAATATLTVSTLQMTHYIYEAAAPHCGFHSQSLLTLFLILVQMAACKERPVGAT